MKRRKKDKTIDSVQVRPILHRVPGIPVHTFSVDASINHRTGKIGIGILVQVRDDGVKRKGPVAAKIRESHGLEHRKSPEKFAVLRALQIAREMNARIVVVRSDHNQMRTGLKEKYADFQIPESPGLDQEILKLADTFDLVKFSYVLRRKNQAALRLAQEAAGIRPRLLTNNDENQSE